MGEAKAKQIAAAAQAELEDAEASMIESVLPQEIRPKGDWMLMKPAAPEERFRGGTLYTPSSSLTISREERLKKAFGTVIERPRFRVIAVGPDVENYTAGDEVLTTRMAFVSKGTAYNLTGFGLFFMCREEEITASVKRMSDEEAQVILDARADKAIGEETTS